jgi:hypothetical protein
MININQDSSNELVFYVNKTETYFLLKFVKEDTGAIKRCICTDSSTQIGAIILTLVEVGTGTEDILNGEVALGVGGWDLYLYEQSSSTNIDENLAEYLHHEDCYVYGDIAESKSPKCKPVTIVDGLSIISKNAGEAYTCSGGGGPCADATVTVNGNLFDTVASGGTLEVPVEYENGTPVGTIAGGVVEIPNPIVCADATAVIKDSVGTTLKTEAIPSGASEDIIISDGNCEVFNTALDMVAQGSITAEGYLSLEAPDGIVRVRKSDSVLISSQSVPSGGLVNYNVADSTININSSLFTTVKATETANIPVKNTAVDNVGSDISGTWRIADATIQNSDASYTTTVKAEGTKILPDITLTQPNGVGETKKSVINLSCTQINALANADLISQLTTGQVVAIAEGRMTPMPVNPNAHQLHSSVLPASSVTGDWRDQYNNGRLSHPTYTNLSRVYMLSDALNFLSYTPNPFGHLKRFTGRTGSYYDEVSNTWKDKNSGAVASHVLAFPDGIIYDHYTGRAWHHNLALYTGINFATIVSNAAALTTHGLTWRVPTLLEFSSIAINTMTNPSGLSYSTHFNTTTAKIFTHNTATQVQWTANVDPTTTANNYCMRSTTTANLIVSDIRTSSSGRGGTVCANFNTSDLTL